jgi:pSer/pThr/pTyr-binding forkhead associated (FHA) protein
MPIRLVPLSAGVGPVVPLDRPVILVGRHPECDTRIDLPSISRRHCCLALVNDRVMIRDLGSRHGVWVNGQRVEEAPLRLSDEIAIGPLLFRLESAAPTTPAPAASDRPAQPAALPELPPLDDEEGDLIPLDGLFPEP